MPTVSHEHFQTHHYCIFSQKENCAGFPIEPDHPACNCIDVFLVDELVSHINNNDNIKE